MWIRGTKLIKNPYFRRAIFVIFWACSFAALFIFSLKIDISRSDIPSLLSNFGLSKNQTGKLGYTRFDEAYRPVYSVRLSNLETENSNVGIFKTPLIKAIQIKDLGISLYSYITPVKASPDYLDMGNVGSSNNEIYDDLAVLVKDTIRRLANPENGWRISGIDLSNTTRVVVNNFDYNLFYDSNQVLSIQSKRAVAFLGQSDLLLHGRVFISTVEGNTLEANRINWDLEKQLFNIKGVFVLNRNGSKSIGRDACVDTKLNLIKSQQVKIYKETKECFVKLP